MGRTIRLSLRLGVVGEEAFFYAIIMREVIIGRDENTHGYVSVQTYRHASINCIRTAGLLRERLFRCWFVVGGFRVVMVTTGVSDNTKRRISNLEHFTGTVSETRAENTRFSLSATHVERVFSV